MGPLKAGTGCSTHWTARGGSTGLPLGPRPTSHGTIPQAAASAASKAVPNGMSCMQAHVTANTGSLWIPRNRGASSSHVRHWASHTGSAEINSTSINSLSGQTLVPSVCRGNGRESGIIVGAPQGKGINNMGTVAGMTTRDQSCAGATTTRTRGGTVVMVATTSPQSEVVGSPQQRVIRSVVPMKPAEGACSSQQAWETRKPSSGSAGFPQAGGYPEGMQRSLCNVQRNSPICYDEMNANPHGSNRPGSVGGSVVCVRKQQGSIFCPGKQAGSASGSIICPSRSSPGVHHRVIRPCQVTSSFGSLVGQGGQLGQNRNKQLGSSSGTFVCPSRRPSNMVVPLVTTWVVSLPGKSQQQQQQQRQLTSTAAGGLAARRNLAPRHPELQLCGLPCELLQHCVNLLPTFADRCRVRAVCRVAHLSDWRLAPPLRPEEELSGIGLGDLGAKAVAKALTPGRGSALRELCLGGNGIADNGAQELAKALGSGSTLRRLSLRHNDIGDEGAQALAVALASNSELEELDMWGNKLTEKGKTSLLAAARCKVFLELDDPLYGQTNLSAGQAVVTGMMRAVLFDWLSEVHNSGSAPAALNGESDPQEMLFRTFSHVDAYLSRQAVHRSELQLIGVACTLAAAIVHGKEDVEDSAELASWLAFVTDGACTEQEVRERARDVHQALSFRLHQPTAYTFLRRYLRKTGWTEESFSLANYLIELSAIDPDFRIYRPQTIAAAAAVLSRQYLSQGISVQHVPGWKARLLRCARVDLKSELAPCAAAMARMHALEHGHRSKFVNVKYEWARLHMVAKIAPNSPPDAESFMTYLSEDRAA